jgi:hypothetical protein
MTCRKVGSAFTAPTFFERQKHIKLPTAKVFVPFAWAKRILRSVKAGSKFAT